MIIVFRGLYDLLITDGVVKKEEELFEKRYSIIAEYNKVIGLTLDKSTAFFLFKEALAKIPDLTDNSPSEDDYLDAAIAAATILGENFIARTQHDDLVCFVASWPRYIDGSFRSNFLRRIG